MRCARCPVAIDLTCPGEDAARLCDLIDPSHPDYTPSYRVAIQAHARPHETEDPDAIIARVEDAQARWDALPPEQRRGCCSGDDLIG